MHVLFDDAGEPVAVHDFQPDKRRWAKTLKQFGATTSKPANECTSAEYEQAVRNQRDPRRVISNSAQRRRTDGHGYRGGDGMTDI